MTKNRLIKIVLVTMVLLFGVWWLKSKELVTDSAVPESFAQPNNKSSNEILVHEYDGKIPLDFFAKKESATGPVSTAVKSIRDFPLASLVLVGIIRTKGKTWAVLKASNDYYYRVAKGNVVSESLAKVSEIGLNNLLLIEDGGVKQMARKIVLKLNVSR